MATATIPRRYRRLRKGSDLSNVAASSSSSKRMRMSLEHNNCEDRISSLPDEILIMILDKLDARTTTTTTILSKRWLDLPRRLHTCYDFAVDEILPPRYHRLKQIMMEAKAGYEAEKKAQKLTDIYAIKDRYERWMWKVHLLTPILQRYERWAMRYYVKRVNAFLLAADNVHQSRSIQKLRLQTFGGRRCIDQWVTAAIARWGVEDLELDIKEPGWLYDFRLLDVCQNLRLKRLVMSCACHIYAHNSLTFQGLTNLTLYNSAHLISPWHILRHCVQLVDFRLNYTGIYYGVFQIYSPASKLKYLQLDSCNIRKICLISLPCLETFSCRGQPTKLNYGEVPRLRHVSLDFSQTGDNSKDEYSSGRSMTYPLRKFFKGMPPLEYLVMQFKGPQMWIEPTVIPGLFSDIRKLFIANMPMNWDMFWILILLDAAPALESLHVHIDNSSKKMSAGLDVLVEHCQYHHLKELVVIGFDGAGWQTGFVKQIIRASPRLRRVHLLDGHVVEDDEQELGGLKIVQHRQEWHECERSEVLGDLTDGISLQHLEMIFE